MSDHVAIIKSVPDGQIPCGCDAVLDWSIYSARHGERFRHYGRNQISELIGQTIVGIISRAVNLTVAWSDSDLTGTDPEEATKLFRHLSPVFVCPERPVTPIRRVITHWVIATHGAVQTLPAAAIEAEFGKLCRDAYPQWRPRSEPWTAQALMLRHGTDGEAEKFVPPEPLLGDRLLAAISGEPSVMEANRRADASLPATMADLCRIRIEAMRRMGIAESDFAYMFSGQATDALAYPLTRSPFDCAHTLTLLRRQFTLCFEENADAALIYALDNCNLEPGRVALLKERLLAMAPAA
jgi:hypothetical protein